MNEPTLQDCEDAGFDVAINFPNTINCAAVFFSTSERTDAWARGLMRGAHQRWPLRKNQPLSLAPCCGDYQNCMRPCTPRGRELYKASMQPMPSGVDAILRERLRQVEKEGWTPEHDDEHDKGELAQAAVCYAVARAPSAWAYAWPWDPSWWKPTTHRRNLEKAGALIAAEIERLHRIDRKKQPRVYENSTEPPTIRVHELKTWSKYYQAVLDGRKRFELRKDDRDYKVGDILELREWEPDRLDDSAGAYTGRISRQKIAFLMEDPTGSWLQPGVVCMSLERMS